MIVGVVLLCLYFTFGIVVGGAYLYAQAEKNDRITAIEVIGGVLTIFLWPIVLGTIDDDITIWRRRK